MTHRRNPAVGFLFVNCFRRAAFAPRAAATRINMRVRWLAQVRRISREIKPTMVLAFPIMAGMVSHTLVGLADTLMVGRVGVVPLAASAFVMALTHIPLVL